MIAHHPLQKNVHTVAKQNIHVTNVLREMQNVLNVIRRGITAVFVCLRKPRTTAVLSTEQTNTIFWEL